MAFSMIPRLDPTRELAELDGGLEKAVLRVLRSGRFVGGPEVEQFEAEAATFLGVGHAVAVSSGTDALTLAIESLGLKRPGRVATSALTFIATGSAILRAGLQPKFVDIDPHTFNLDPSAVRQAVASDPGIVGVVAVHLYGDTVDLRDAAGGVPVIEDACQAFGSARAGQLGQVAAFSFFPSKPLGGCGDGGLVTTEDREIAMDLRCRRSHGQRSRYRSEFPGYNARLDAIQAAILRTKLPLAEEWRRRRCELAARYDRLLEGHQRIRRPRLAAGHAWHQYTVRVPERDRIQRELGRRGIETSVQYPYPLHQQPAFRCDVQLPETEDACAQILSIPIFPQLLEKEQDEVVAALRDIA